MEYVVAGETLQTYKALSHPRDILYGLSRNTAMSPLQLATLGFNKADEPVFVPTDVWTEEEWPSVGLYNLDEMDSPPITGGDDLMTVFTDFTQILYDEVTYNITKARETFGYIRANCSYPTSAFSSESMMIDLGDFVYKCIENQDKMHFGDNINLYGTMLLSRLSQGAGKTIINTAYISEYVNENFTGFSICFPYTQDMYQEYLYANFYEDLDVSVNSYWDEFIFAIYPPDEPFFIPWKYLDFYEVHLGPIDPTIHLDIYCRIDPYVQPYHIGYTGPISDYGMGIDADIEGIEFIDDLLTGACTIRIPTSNLPIMKQENSHLFEIVINATNAASATMDADLTVNHIVDNEIIWTANEVVDIEVGQAIGTNITTDDDWTEFIELTPPLETKRFGPEITAKSVMILVVIPLIILTIYRKKKQK
ncbi:MAG: hypothetical protein FK734_06835 [Asgard group archaeon]|nr:hypothetical protein [Asgard group archaeon]